VISKIRFNLPLCALGAGAVHALLLAVALPTMITLPGPAETVETGTVETEAAGDTAATAIDTGPPIVDSGHIAVDVEIVPAANTAGATNAPSPSAGRTVTPDLAEFAAAPAPIATPIPHTALQQQAALPDPSPEKPTGSIDTDAVPQAATEPTAGPAPEITPAEDDDVAEPPASAAPPPAEEAVANVVPDEPAPPLPRRKPKFAALKPPPLPQAAKTMAKPKIQRKVAATPRAPAQRPGRFSRSKSAQHAAAPRAPAKAPATGLNAFFNGSAPQTPKGKRP